MRAWKKSSEKEQNMPGRLTVCTWFFALMVLMFPPHGGAAPAGIIPLPLSCDFEHGMCGFSSHSDLTWKTTNHLYGSALLGIPSDHTSGSGYYAYPDVHNFFTHKDTVGELVSPTFHHAGQVCVQFAAFFTRDTPPLQVTVDHRGNTQKVGEASLASGHWETYNFSFPTQGDYTIHFVAKKDSSTELTGLDDIKVQTCDSEEVTTIISTPSATTPTTTATLTTASSIPATTAAAPTTTPDILTTPPAMTTTTTAAITRTTTTTTSPSTGTTKTTTPVTKSTTPSNKTSDPTKATSAPNKPTNAMINPTTATTPLTAATTTPSILATTPTPPIHTPTIGTTAPSSQTNTPHTSASTPTMSAILTGHFTSSGKGQVASSTTEVTPSPTPSLLDGFWHVVLAMWKEAGTSSPDLGSSATQSPSHELGLLNKRHRLQKMSLDLKVNVEELE